MTKQNHELKNVFGLIRDVPETYVSRDADRKLKEALYGGKHVVIRGDTKQGKTCLRKVTLPDDVCIVVTCQKEWGFADLSRNILRKSGAKTTEVTRDSSASAKLSPRVTGNIGVVKVEFGGDVTGNDGSKITFKEFEINFEDMGDVVEILKQSTDKKFIIIDDFHSLEQRVQYSFASAIKAAFEDSDYTFVVVGVWREENKLVRLNGDLQGRVTDVSVGTWQRKELLEIIKKGEDLLNIKIDEDFKSEIVDNCYGSVFIVQEACKKICMAKGIFSTQSFMVRIGSVSEARKLLDDLGKDMTTRYGEFIADFLKLGGKTVDRSSVEDYISIVNVLLTQPISRLEHGVSLADMMNFKRSRFKPKKDFEKTMRTALAEIGHCQTALGYNPIILSYDNSTAHLEVVDKGFLFWLSRIDRINLLREHAYVR